MRISTHGSSPNQSQYLIICACAITIRGVWVDQSHWGDFSELRLSLPEALALKAATRDAAAAAHCGTRELVNTKLDRLMYARQCVSTSVVPHGSVRERKGKGIEVLWCG